VSRRLPCNLMYVFRARLFSTESRHDEFEPIVARARDDLSVDGCTDPILQFRHNDFERIVERPHNGGWSKCEYLAANGGILVVFWGIFVGCFAPKLVHKYSDQGSGVRGQRSEEFESEEPKRLMGSWFFPRSLRRGGRGTGGTLSYGLTGLGPCARRVLRRARGAACPKRSTTTFHGLQRSSLRAWSGSGM
jgi:hypothetical protein